MPRRSPVDTVAISRLLEPGRSVATHQELRQLGLPASTISHRCGPVGPWQRLLPGVVAGHRGRPTTYERRLAALAYAGEGAALTGLDALDELGLALPGLRHDDRVHVVIPHQRQRLSHGFALVTRSQDLGETTTRRRLPRVTLARAVTDAARRTEDLGEVRTLVARAVQQRRCTAEDLIAQLHRAPRQRTALLRSVLREVSTGVRSEAEARARVVFRERGVPEPRWNAPVRQEDGTTIAVVDGLWEEEGLALEIDSEEWHLDPAAWKATQARQRRLVLAGLTVLAVAPGDVTQHPERVCEEVLAALAMLRRGRAEGPAAHAA